MIISISGRMKSGKDTVARIIQWLVYNTSCISLEHWLDPRHSEEYRSGASGWRIKKWADALRRVAHVLLPQYKLEYLYTDEFKNSVIEGWDREVLECGCKECERAKESDTPGYSCVDVSYCYNPITITKQTTGRYFLQLLGTDAIRNGLHTDAWVKALMAEYKDKHKRLRPLYDKRDMGQPDPEYPNWIITDTRFPNELEAVKEVGGITIWIDRPMERSEIQHESETALDNAKFDYHIHNNGSLEELSEHIKHILAIIT